MRYLNVRKGVNHQMVITDKLEQNNESGIKCFSFINSRCWSCARKAGTMVSLGAVMRSSDFLARTAACRCSIGIWRLELHEHALTDHHRCCCVPASAPPSWAPAAAAASALLRSPSLPSARATASTPQPASAVTSKRPGPYRSRTLRSSASCAPRCACALDARSVAHTSITSRRSAQ